MEYTSRANNRITRANPPIEAALAIQLGQWSGDHNRPPATNFPLSQQTVCRTTDIPETFWFGCDNVVKTAANNFIATKVSYILVAATLHKNVATTSIQL